jgi:DNA-binding transcriptional LysR family regulator
MTGLWRQARQETSLPEGVTAVCNFGCHVDLWPGPGRAFFEAVNRLSPTMALSASQGEQEALERQLGSGLVDVAMTYRPSVHGNRTIHALRPERLVLYATRPDNPIRFTPDYIYVDLGEEYRDQHAAAYADAGISRVSFDSAIWALDFLLANGGSAYLPERLADPYKTEGRLHAIDVAPVFTRNTYLVVNDQAAAGWHWLPELVRDLAS